MKKPDTCREFKTSEAHRRAFMKYRTQNPEHYRRLQRESYQRLREKVFDMYGHSCVHCGFSALQLDHVQNDGFKSYCRTQSNYRKAIRLNDQTQFQILCANCNWIKKTEYETKARIM